MSADRNGPQVSRPAVGAAVETATTRELYEQVPYPSEARPFSHPDRLAAAAILHGVAPAPVAGCRVIELGCSDGGNLLPMAINLPASRFLGVDLAPGHIATARRAAADLGLSNVEFRVLDIAAADADLGRFDYVLAHGLFSWIPPALQDRLLELYAQLLADRGVGYISYNVLPGWYANLKARGVLLYHGRGIADGRKRVDAALEVLDVLARNGSDPPTAAHARTLLENAPRLPHLQSYFLHEYLAEDNHPIWFADFARRIGAAGLQYVADADPAFAEPLELSEADAARLAGWATDRVAREQYTDILRDTAFRRSLLCRAGVPVREAPDPARLAGLHVVTRAEPVTAGGEGGGPPRYRLPSGRTFTAGDSQVASLLAALADAAPAGLAWGRLCDLVCGHGSSEEEAESGDHPLADRVLALADRGVLELRSMPVPCAPRAGSHPRATALARAQAAAGRFVTNQRHGSIDLDDEAARFLLQHLDGTRDRAALAGLVRQAVSAGGLGLSRAGHPVRDSAELRRAVPELVERHLDRLARCALLVA